ncbi:M64 family metallopeptidase [Colwellia chukchiensis]|nr:M64 family metallopeptidase [Colwellia chukchiensis]
MFGIMLLSALFIIEDYNAKINNATITRQQLKLLELLTPITDVETRLAQLQQSKPNAWLHLAKLYADSQGEVAYQLGVHFQQQQQLAFATLWYQTAIRQAHSQARLALAKIYFNQQEYQSIAALLKPILNNDQALSLRYQVALQQGELAFIVENQQRLKASENSTLYYELAQYWAFGADVAIDVSNSRYAKPFSCVISVQLFATNLNGLRHGQQLIDDFSQHPLSELICLQTPRYIAADVLDCQHQKHQRINCRATAWRQQELINSRYIGLIVEQGGAYVDNGIMYLDQQDTVDVLVHELSHFIGFVDEYPLPSQHQKCQQNQSAPFAHNIVVLTSDYQGQREDIRAQVLAQVPWRSLIAPTTPILSRNIQGEWKLGTPSEFQDEIGLFSASTCERNGNVKAFKPLSKRTKLEYFELTLPSQYLEILRLAPRQFLMPSYHFNVSKALAEQGELGQAIELLQEMVID